MQCSVAVHNLPLVSEHILPNVHESLSKFPGLSSQSGPIPSSPRPLEDFDHQGGCVATFTQMRHRLRAFKVEVKVFENTLRSIIRTRRAPVITNGGAHVDDDLASLHWTMSAGVNQGQKGVR